MANLGQGDIGELDPDEQRQARLAAMQRALDATPNGSDMNPIGSQEHTPGGQELLGHAGGPNLGDYNKFAEQYPGGDTVQGAIGGAIGGAVSAVGGATTGAIERARTAATAGSLGGVLAGGGAPADNWEREPVGTGGAVSAQPQAIEQPKTMTPGGAATTTGNGPITTIPSIGNGPAGTGGNNTITTGGTTTPPPAGQNYGDLLSHPETAGAAGSAGAAGAAGLGASGAPAGAGSGQIGAGTGGGDLGALTGSIMTQLQQISAGLGSASTPVDASAVFMKQAQSILNMLNDQESSLRSEYQKNGTQIDPATQFTLDQLRQTLEKNLTGVREDLNRRGLYDSGIELQLENNLQKGNASDQAQLLSTRLSKLQDQLDAGLTQIRGQKFSTASQFGLAGANAQNSWDENSRSLQQKREADALNAMLGLRGQMSASETARATIAAENARNAASLANAYQIAQGNNANAMNIAQLNAARARGTGTGTGTGGGGGGNTTGSGKYTGQNITGYPNVAGEGNPYGGSTPTGNNVNAAATNAAIDRVGNARDRTHAITDFANAYTTLIKKGVDPQAVQDEIDRQFPPSADEVRGNKYVGGPV